MQVPKWFIAVVGGSGTLLGLVIGAATVSWKASAALADLTGEVRSLREAMTETVKPTVAKVAEHDIRLAILEHRPSSAVSTPAVLP